MGRLRLWFSRQVASPVVGAAPEPLACNADDAIWHEAERLSRAGEPLAAIASLEDHLASAEEPAKIHFRIGVLRLTLPDISGASEAFAVAVALDPSHGEAWLGLGETLFRLNQTAGALEALEKGRVCIGDEHRVALLCQMGRVLLAALKFEEAKRAFVEASTRQVDHVPAILGLADAELMLENYEESIQLFEQAEALGTPADPARNLKLALMCRYTGRIERADALLDEVFRRAPHDHNVRWHLSHVKLGRCEWQEGWSAYGARFPSGAVPYRPLPFKTWPGGNTPGQTVVVLAEQGLGDEIMFAACLPEVVARSGHCIVECEPRLATLFKRSFPEVTVLATRREQDASWLQGQREPDWQIFSGDLPALFRSRDEDFPRHTGYLKADPERVTHWRRRLTEAVGDGLLVGISWRGGTDRTRIRSRSTPVDAWEPILTQTGCQFVNLQYGESEAMRQEMTSRYGVTVHHFGEALDDYDETAALVCALDLVITVCTSIVHLAGALGKPVWVLAPMVPEWRYTTSRSSVPWYPSSRVFRQRAWDDWTDNCREVSLQLTELTSCGFSGTRKPPEMTA